MRAPVWLPPSWLPERSELPAFPPSRAISQKLPDHRAPGRALGVGNANGRDVSGVAAGFAMTTDGCSPPSAAATGRTVGDAPGNGAVATAMSLGLDGGRFSPVSCAPFSRWWAPGIPASRVSTARTSPDPALVRVATAVARADTGAVVATAAAGPGSGLAASGSPCERMMRRTAVQPPSTATKNRNGRPGGLNARCPASPVRGIYALSCPISPTVRAALKCSA